MKSNWKKPDLMKRKLVALFASVPWFTACESGYYRSARLAYEAQESARYNALSPEEKRLHEILRTKFRGIYGVVLRLDAVAPKNGVMINSETGASISAPVTLGPKNVGNQTYTSNSLPIPKVIHVTWREGTYQYAGQGVWTGGTIIGDYTVPVAERIPDEVLNYIRSDNREPYWVGKSVHDGSDVFATPIGRALRLKIRLTDDDVLIGWDVEERIRTKFGTGLKYKLAGGDFREAQILDGKVIDPGWQK